MFEYHYAVLTEEELDLSQGGTQHVKYVDVAFYKTPQHWQDNEDFVYDEMDNWEVLDASLKKIMTEELAQAVAKGNVVSLTMSLEPYGDETFLNLERENGWTVILYNGEDGIVPMNQDYIDSQEEAFLAYGKQTPVPKMFALTDNKLISEIVVYFLETGRLSSKVSWAKSSEEGGLPWVF